MVSGAESICGRRIADFLKKEARKDLERLVAVLRPHRRPQGQVAELQGYTQPLGLLRGGWSPELLLAHRHGAAEGDRLSGGARGRASARDESRTGFLGSSAKSSARNGRRQVLAEAQRHHASRHRFRLIRRLAPACFHSVTDLWRLTAKCIDDEARMLSAGFRELL